MVLGRRSVLSTVGVGELAQDGEQLIGGALPGGGHAQAGGALVGVVEVDDGVEDLEVAEGVAGAGETSGCVVDVGVAVAQAPRDVAALYEQNGSTNHGNADLSRSAD